MIKIRSLVLSLFAFASGLSLAAAAANAAPSRGFMPPPSPAVSKSAPVVSKSFAQAASPSAPTISRPASTNSAPTASGNKPTVVSRPAAPWNQRVNPVSLAPTKASQPPNLSRQFYAARDGWPANGGFVAGSQRNTVLKPGSIVGRRGDGAGRYATTTWDPKPGSLGLYPKADRQPMRYWRVQRPVNAVTGQASPAWSAQGGGNQLLLSNRPDTLARHGFMRRTITPNFKMAAGRR